MAGVLGRASRGGGVYPDLCRVDGKCRVLTRAISRKKHGELWAKKIGLVSFSDMKVGRDLQTLSERQLHTYTARPLEIHLPWDPCGPTSRNLLGR